MWTVNHLADIESDFSVFHRVDDPLALAGPEFFRKAVRLAAYTGVMAARVAAQHERSQPLAATGRGAGSEVRTVSLDTMMAQHPDLIDRR
jgi:hypothetical protein